MLSPAAALSPVSDPSPSDHELMIAVRAGEVARLGDLFERHQLPLFGFFVRLTSDRTTAEDLVQAVFHRVLKYRRTYRDEGKFSAWLYHLARRVAADHSRRHARAPIAADPADLPDPVDEAPHAGEQTARAEDIAFMQTALAALPLDQREVLILHRFQHLRYDEIARLLNVSVGAAKVRAHRALSALRDHYFKLRREPAA